jgi:hypothetical protein
MPVDDSGGVVPFEDATVIRSMASALAPGDARGDLADQG